MYWHTIPTDLARFPENRLAVRARVGSIWQYFTALKDPRVRQRTEHRLIDIIAIALCGVITAAFAIKCIV